MTEILNKFFSSAFVHNNVNDRNLGDSYQIDELDSFTITHNKVHYIFQKLNENKALGDNGLKAFLLKRTCNDIVVPLSDTFNNSLNTGSIPNNSKLAKVTSIFK